MLGTLKGPDILIESGLLSGAPVLNMRCADNPRACQVQLDT